MVELECPTYTGERITSGWEENVRSVKDQRCRSRKSLKLIFFLNVEFKQKKGGIWMLMHKGPFCLSFRNLVLDNRMILTTGLSISKKGSANRKTYRSSELGYGRQVARYNVSHQSHHNTFSEIAHKENFVNVYCVGYGCTL